MGTGITAIAAAGAIIAAGAAAVDTITAGATTTAATITDNRISSCAAGVDPLPRRKRAPADGRSRPTGATCSTPAGPDAVQPNPISTAIRIRSEWFLAPSFCFSSEVVLATVL